MPMQRPTFFLVLALAALNGCATLPPGERDSRDRFERTNRAIYRFNDSLDRHIAKPLTKGYIKIAPRPVRTGVSNFFQNLTYPTVIVNDLFRQRHSPFGSQHQHRNRRII
jgi:phospholipid-binding lipoprotein MlaA